MSAARDIVHAIVVQGDENLVIVDPHWLWQRIGAQRTPPPEALARYLAYLVDRYRFLELKGMGVSDRLPLRMPLVETYVPLTARLELPRGEAARDLRIAGRRMPFEEKALGDAVSRPQPVLDVLKGNAGVVVLGDPGSGKTTFLKYLALRLAQGEGEELGLGARLPILVPLSAYANALAARDIPLDTFLHQHYRARGIDLPIEGLVQQALAGGGGLVLLDGLDEVREADRRHLVVSRFCDFFSFHRPKGNKFVITSRIVGYRDVRPNLEGLAECTLVDFGDEEIEAFVLKWTAAVEKSARGQTAVATHEAEWEMQELLSAVRHNAGVRGLATNPLLLTILALMKRQGVALPERRVELYRNYVETLLKHWNLARGLDRSPSRDLDLVETLRVLAPLALWMHETSPGVGLVPAEKMKRRLEEIYVSRDQPEPEKLARRFLEDVHEHASLLLERGPGEYGFIHLTFQEYLSGVALAMQAQRSAEKVIEALSAHVGDPLWREMSLLAIAYIGIVQQRDEVADDVVKGLLLRAPGQAGQAAALCGEAVADAFPGGVSPGCRAEVVQVLLDTMRDDARVKPQFRAGAGNALARLGDPRFREDLWFLPDEPLLGFVKIPGGAFVMGEGAQSHTVSLPTYYVARYPVTVAQFRAFVEDERFEPADRDCLRGVSNHPVARVGWEDAMAYAAWLTRRLRESEHTPDPLAMLLRNHTGKSGPWVVTLPSEAEWEKAARGTHGRAYPWGEERDPNRANYGASGIGTTSAVGCFPGGQSLFEVEEMSGNVEEWTRSLSEKYPYVPWDFREKRNAPRHARRVARGGGFDDDGSSLGAASRAFFQPSGLYDSFGFRVVVSPLTLKSVPPGL